MNTRSKRSNEESHSDAPSSKKAATGNGKANHDQPLLRAQAALDRLDVKSAYDICTEIGARILRSVALERRGLPYEAAKDVEKAMEGKETREIHLRATFNHLAIALHHLETAQQLPLREDELSVSHLTDSHLLDLKDEISKSKGRQLKTPFKRLSPELFVETMSFTDSPSLAISSSVCKSWNESILGSIELFRHFRMEGEVSSIIKGIKLFGERSGNSIESIELKIGTEATSGEQDQLQESIKPSSRTLKSLSISHAGDLSKTILNIASECNQLKVLASLKAGTAFTFNRSESEPEVAFPATWKPKLHTLTWQGSGNVITCDDSLIGHLQWARKVTLCSLGVQPSWVIKLLSSNKKLKTVNIPWIEDEIATEVYLMDLPNLKHLRLDRAPRSIDGNGKENGKAFFKQLQTPILISLEIYEVDSRDLVEVQNPGSIEEFSTSALLNLDQKDEEAAATSVVGAMKDWTRLCKLNLFLSRSTSPKFWNLLIRLLSPSSRESIEAGFRDSVVLPKVAHLVLGAEDSELSEDSAPSAASSISAHAIMSLVAARIAANMGLSSPEVALAAASGEFEFRSQEFGTSATPGCSTIEILRIYHPTPLTEEQEKSLASKLSKCTIKR